MNVFGKLLLPLGILLSLVVSPALCDDDFPKFEGDLAFHDYGSLKAELATGQKDVFVMFYAEWCGHCKAMKETWSSLATAYSDDSNVLQIAKIEADKDRNLAKEYNISGFPTLKYFKVDPGEKVQVIDYTGGRGINDLIHFVNENSKTARNAEGKRVFPVESDPAQVAYIKKLVNSKSKDESKKLLEEIKNLCDQADFAKYPQTAHYYKVASEYVKNPSKLADMSKKLKVLTKEKAASISHQSWRSAVLALKVLKDYEENKNASTDTENDDYEL